MERIDIKLWDGDIPYYKDELDTPNLLEFYPVESDKPLPCALIMPGGSYHYREKGENLPIAEFFYKNGIHAAVVSYRVEPNRFPAPLADAQRAIKLLRHNADKWNIDPDKIVSVGFSAGGHLAASTITLPDVLTGDAVRDEADKQSALPNAAILAYPVISVEEEFGHVNSGKNLLGDDYEELKSEFSLQNRVHASTPPVFIWHTVEDSCVNVKNTLVFGEALRDAGIPFEMHIYPRGRHGLALAEGFDDVKGWSALALDWLDRNIFAEKK